MSASDAPHDSRDHRRDDRQDDSRPGPDRPGEVGEPADTHGTTVASEADTVTTGYGERTVDHRTGDEGLDAIERHRRSAAAVGEPAAPTETGETGETVPDEPDEPDVGEH